jgi:signal transduction histidine kinase
VANKTGRFCLVICVLCIFIGFGKYRVAYAQETELLSKKELVSLNLTKLDTTSRMDIKFGAARELFYIYINDDLDKAIEYALLAKEYAADYESPWPVISSYITLGDAYTKIGDFEQAFHYLSLAEEYVSSTDIPIRAALNAFYIGRAYVELRLIKVAEPYILEAEQNFLNPRNRWQASYEHSRILLMTGDTLAASENVDLLKATIPETNNEVNTDYLYHYVVLAELFSNINQPNQAEEILNEILPYVKIADRNYYSGIAYLTLSKVELSKDNISEALEYAEMALDFFELQKENSYIIKTLAQLAAIYEYRGDFENAYEYLSQHNQKYESIIQIRESAVSDRLEIQTSENHSTTQQLEETEDLLNQRQILIIALSILLVGVLFLLVVVDRSTKDKRKAASRLDNINKEKDHFIGVVSHDLRSPLNSIMVLSSIMKEDASSLTTDEIEEYSNIIQNSSKRMEHMVNNMLDANKIETGNAGLRLKEMNIKECLESVYHSTLILGNEKEIKTELHIEEGLPNIIGEPNAVSRIVENLMSNAYKFSPAGSTVTIKVSDEGPQIQLAVSDKGPGLTDLDRSKLFHKFEKLSASPTANEKTTGLGLYIVKNLMKEMDGTILVESEHGNGTTFKVLFNKA